MPIEYEVRDKGHTIIAVASGEVMGEEFAEYEINHAVDPRIKAPVSELLLVQSGAFRRITEEDVGKVLGRRKEMPDAPNPHNCGIVISSGDVKSWNIAKFYEGMARLHYPKNVIVFGDEFIARLWLGIEN